jgi:hypothetical protein
MPDGQRLVVELRKLKVPVTTIKKQITNVWKPRLVVELRKLKVPVATIKKEKNNA